MRRAKGAPKLDPYALVPIHLKAIPLLMARSKIPWALGPAKFKLKPEEEKCVEFADMMRAYVDHGYYKGIWCHIPNEGQRSALGQIILRAMGLIKGATDYMFMGPWGHGVIEFKTGTNNLEEYQRYFRFWCDKEGVHHATVWNAGQAVAALREWGALPYELPMNVRRQTRDCLPALSSDTHPTLPV